MPEGNPAVDLAELARDIAIEFHGLPTILRAHEISDEQWAQISVNPQFLAMAAEMKRTWDSAGNAKERVRMKASTAVEAMLPIILNDIASPATPLAQKTEALKLLAKLGELGETQREGGDAGERFHVTINLGAGAPPVTVSAAAPAMKTIDLEAKAP
jgi:hypothetical protein